MTDEALIEQVAGAHRERRADGTILPHPAWFDLDEAQRAEAFEATTHSRALEAATDPRGLSTTAHAVLNRVLGR